MEMLNQDNKAIDISQMQKMAGIKPQNLVKLIQTKRTSPELLNRMSIHYSRPKGFVGRNICYAIYFGDEYLGHIVGGSATLHLPNRNNFFGIGPQDLNHIVNNIFYNVAAPENGYPFRNFTTFVLNKFVNQCATDWEEKYGDKVIGFETLVEKPRTGDLYLKAGWTNIGETKGFTCKRTAGKGTDEWGGKRVWCTDPDKLRPKTVFVKKV